MQFFKSGQSYEDKRIERYTYKSLQIISPSLNSIHTHYEVATMKNDKIVIFLGRRNAEELVPPNNSAIISITDSVEDEANLKEGWEHTFRVSFIDGAYNEDSLRFVGTNYRYIYSAYFDKGQAIELRGAIDHIVSLGIDKVIVHCHAGRSRSAAIALYIANRYGYLPYNDTKLLTMSPSEWPKPEPTATSQLNTMIYTLLQSPEYFDSVKNEIDAKREQVTPTKKWWSRLASIVTG